MASLFVVYWLSPLHSFVTPWTGVRQAPLSTGFPSKNTGTGCHFLLRGIFLTQGWNPCLLRWQAVSLLWSHWGKEVVFCIEHQQLKAPYALHVVPGTRLWESCFQLLDGSPFRCGHGTNSGMRTLRCAISQALHSHAELLAEEDLDLECPRP